MQCILGEHGSLKGHCLIDIIILCLLSVQILVDENDQKKYSSKINVTWFILSLQLMFSCLYHCISVQ